MWVWLKLKKPLRGVHMRKRAPAQVSSWDDLFACILFTWGWVISYLSYLKVHIDKAPCKTQNHKHNACTTCFCPPADWFHTLTGGCFAFIVQVMGIAALHACFMRGNQPYCTQFMCVQVLQCPWPLLHMRRFPFSQNFQIFRFGSQWKTFRPFIPLENSWEKCKF